MKHPDIIRVGWTTNNRLHNFLVLLYHLARLPLLLCGLLAALFILPAAMMYQFPLAAGAILAVTVLGDLVLLACLPALGISYGWIQPPWLLFSLGRSLAAVLLGLLPLSGALQLVPLAGIQVLLSMLAFYAALVEPFWIQHTDLEVELTGLGSRLSVLLLTDLHVERWTRREARLLQEVERRSPDMILIGGDLLNLSYVGDPEALDAVRRLLGRLHAPAGVFFVRGTWELDPPHLVQTILRGLPIEELDNTVREVSFAGARMRLVGVAADGPPPVREQRLRKVMDRLGPGPPVICVHHTPDLIYLAAELGADLYLAGHTHGGQIWLPLLGPVFSGSRFGRRYIKGYHQVGRAHAYISRGLGMEGLGAPRMRFLSRPEMVWMVIREGPTPVEYLCDKKRDCN